MKTDSNQTTEIIVPLGQALKDARIAASLTIDEVAEQLNFAPSTVRDFEDNLEQVLQTEKYPVIYLRGYLANYAKLVGLNTLELFVEYQQLASTQKKAKKLPVSDLIIPQTKKRSKALPLFFMLVIIIVGVFFFFQKQLLGTIDSTSSIAQSSDVLIESPQASHNVLIAKGELQNSETSDKAPEEAVSESLVIPEESTENVNPKVQPNTETIDAITEDIINEGVINEQPVIEAKSVNLSQAVNTEENIEPLVLNEKPEPEILSLVFNADCWTEVFDANGKRIAFGLYKNGHMLSLSGIAPFKLKLGDPSVVDIQYQNQSIEGEFTPGRSAQFSVPLS